MMLYYCIQYSTMQYGILHVRTMLRFFSAAASSAVRRSRPSEVSKASKAKPEGRSLRWWVAWRGGGCSESSSFLFSFHSTFSILTHCCMIKANCPTRFADDDFGSIRIIKSGEWEKEGLWSWWVGCGGVELRSVVGELPSRTIICSAVHRVKARASST